MINLVSPEYSFEDFCQQMLGRDPMEVIDAASEEITYARRNHEESTGERNFRKGSRGRAYCDDLQRLVTLFMGSVSERPPSEFLNAVRPLAVDLLKKWDIVGFREVMSMSRQIERSQKSAQLADFLTVVISRQEVEAGNIRGPLSVLRRLVESPQTARQFAERVDIVFHGYDDTPQELFEMESVRDFVAKLDEQFPYWLFFLSKHCPGLQCLFLCLLREPVVRVADAELSRQRVSDLLLRRWFPAMNHVCAYAGFSEQEVNGLTDRVEAYITHGGLRNPDQVGT